MNQEQRSPEETILLKTVLEGRFDAFRMGAQYSPLPNAEFRRRECNSVYAWGMDYVCANGVMEDDASRIPSEKEIDEIVQHFSAKELPFMWWTGAEILGTKGFQFGGNLTGIALDISQGLPPEKSASDDIKVAMASTETALRAFTTLAADAFAMSPKATEQWLALNEALMKSDENVHFVAYSKEIPVGTATLTVSRSSAGIWNLSTASEYRNHGIGSALVHAALVEAKKRKHRQMMAILMPKGMAWGLFTKLGFKAVCEFPFYIHGISASELEK